LRNILDYVGGGVKPSDLVQGAKDAKDALELFKKDEGKFVRPVTVDWTHGKAVVGDNESEILKTVLRLRVPISDRSPRYLVTRLSGSSCLPTCSLSRDDYPPNSHLRRW
jgi:hypothetical protein